jgi:glycosyltransferase involved in cell wall biosynthesis
MVLGYVGRWARDKGADRACVVWARAKKALGESVGFVIAGDCSEYEVPEGATVLGHLREEELWHSMIRQGVRVLLFLSRGEPWGYALHEAMAVGIVPVTTPEVAASELLWDIEPALVAEDFDGATSIVIRLLQDDAYWLRMSEKCRERALRDDPEGLVGQLFSRLGLPSGRRTRGHG